MNDVPSNDKLNVAVSSDHGRPGPPGLVPPPVVFAAIIAVVLVIIIVMALLGHDPLLGS